MSTMKERVSHISSLLSISAEESKNIFPHLFSETEYKYKPAENWKNEIPSFIDHTLLKSQATEADITTLVSEAVSHRFKAVCVNSSIAQFTKQQLQQSSSHVPQLAVVVGFPLGACTTRTKIAETADAVSLGASEIDMVINVGWIKEGEKKYKTIYEEISGIVKEAGSHKAIVKVILETAYLSENEIVDACILSALAGAHFVKTSTGFATPAAGKAAGATTENVALMRNVVGDRIGVKASGGVRSFDDAKGMIEAGATRIGTSNGVAIVKGVVATNSY